MEVKNVKVAEEVTWNDVFSTPASEIVADMDELIEEILLHISEKPTELMKYRLVSHKWNDVIVRKNARAKNFFQVKLRYGPEVPRFIAKSDAQRRAGQILETAEKVLTSTTVSGLEFNSLLIDRDFYLVGVMPQWTRFLERCGELVAHLKIEIKPEKFPGPYVNYVKDCAVVVNTESLYAAFCALPNLESLDLCIKFSHYGASPFDQANNINVKFPNFRYCKLPQLQKLTKITIVEPFEEEYPNIFVQNLILMAPNLSSLYYRSSGDPGPFMNALRDIRSRLPRHPTLTTFGISHVDNVIGRCTRFQLAVFNLTKLEIDNVYSVDTRDNSSRMWIDRFVRNVRSTLVTLILGSRTREQAGPGRNTNFHFLSDRLSFTGDTMESLRVLEVNLSKFKLAPIRSYQKMFPMLESLTFTNYEVNVNSWHFHHLTHLLPGNTGRSLTVKDFLLLGPIVSAVETEQIMTGVRTTFPLANHFLGL